MIIKPKYINNVEVITPLYERFNDNSVKFYKTRYIISEKFYTPKIVQDSNGNIVYPAMNKIYSKDNVLLFPKEFDYSKYRLLNEDVERNSNIPEYITVTETWGYTPTIQFNNPSIVSWQKPGMYDESSTTTSTNVLSTNITETQTIYLDNSDGKFKAGDVVQFTMPRFVYSSGTKWYYKQVGDYVTISSATTNYITVPVFKITIYYDNGQISTTINSNSFTTGNESMFYIKQSYPVLCNINCSLIAKVRSPYSGDFPCIDNYQFITVDNFDSLLNLLPAWTVKIGGQDTDTLTQYTVPTLDEYNSNIGTTEVLLATPETMERLIGNIFILNKKYIRYQ